MRVGFEKGYLGFGCMGVFVGVFFWGGLGILWIYEKGYLVWICVGG